MQLPWQIQIDDALWYHEVENRTQVVEEAGFGTVVGPGFTQQFEVGSVGGQSVCDAVFRECLWGEGKEALEKDSD